MAIGVPVCQRLTFGIAGCYIYIWRGVFYVARFDYEGHVERPQNVKRATVQGFTSFLYLYLREKLNHLHDYQYRLALAVRKRHEAD